MNTRLKFENLFNRFFSQEIIYEITNEKKYMKQYESLIKVCYKSDLDIDVVSDNMQGGITDHADNEVIFIVRQGNRVIGGSKLSFSENNSEYGLQMEEGGYEVYQYLPEDYGNTSYGEIGRLVVDPTYRGKDILTNMIDNLMNYAASRNCGFLFVLAPALNSVLYRRVCKRLKINIKVLKDAPIPDKELYRRLNMKLLTCDIQYMAQEAVALRIAG